MKRTILAVGDLHGDVHRLERILREHKVLVPETRQWNPNLAQTDVVLLGDYVDWRGEMLEGEPSDWDRGVAELLGFLRSLHQQVADLRKEDAAYSSRLWLIMGNHDKLMLDAYRFVASLGKKAASLKNSWQDVKRVQGAFRFSAPKPGTPEERGYGTLLTWISQGGASTIQSFGGMEAWQMFMADGLQAFLEGSLGLGVVLNGRLFSHSLPDEEKWWMPLKSLRQLPPEERDRAIDAFVWGRRIWGFDYKTGRKVEPPDEAEVDRMLTALGVRGAVVGHSLVNSYLPVKAFGGRIINIDMHGTPGSQPFKEEFEAQAPARA